MIPVTPTLSLDDEEIEEKFVRAPGPGGQNVNKVSTAVQMRFDAKASPNIPFEVFVRLRTIAGSRMTKEGVIVLEAHRFRTRERNREDAVERLVEMIRKACHKPKHRRPTKPSKGAKARRMDAKTRRGAVKQGRKKPGRDDY